MCSPATQPPVPLTVSGLSGEASLPARSLAVVGCSCEAVPQPLRPPTAAPRASATARTRRSATSNPAQAIASGALGAASAPARPPVPEALSPGAATSPPCSPTAEPRATAAAARLNPATCSHAQWIVSGAPGQTSPRAPRPAEVAGSGGHGAPSLQPTAEHLVSAPAMLHSHATQIHAPWIASGARGAPTELVPAHVAEESSCAFEA